MAKSDKLYSKSPKLERDAESGEVEVKKPETTQKEDPKQPENEEEAGSTPYMTDIKDMHSRQHQEMKDMHKRHQKEMEAVAEKHAMADKAKSSEKK